MPEKVRAPETDWHEKNLPTAVREKRHKVFAEELEEAQSDNSMDAVAQHQRALGIANRILRTPKLETYADAMGLEDWQINKNSNGEVQRYVKGGFLHVVTIDGKKHKFAVPAKAQKAADKDKTADSDKDKTAS